MGVTFVSGEPIKTADMEGYRARYSFTDITKVRVDMQQGTPAGTSSGGNQPPFAFAMDRSGATSVLTIKMPETPGGGPLPGLPAGGTDAEKAQAQQALTMMKVMMQGLFVDVSMNIDGKVVKSNVPTEGSKVTLLQIDVDKLFADPAAMEKLQAATTLKSLCRHPRPQGARRADGHDRDRPLSSVVTIRSHSTSSESVAIGCLRPAVPVAGVALVPFLAVQVGMHPRTRRILDRPARCCALPPSRRARRARARRAQA